MPDSTCLSCGRTLTSPTRPRRYCDRTCRKAAPGVVERDRVMRNANKRSKYVPIRHAGRCVVCGAVFVSKRPNRIYCKPECAQFAAYVSVLERGVRDNPVVKAKRKAWLDENRHRYRDTEREAQRRRHAENPQKQRDKDKRSRERRRLTSVDTQLRRHKRRLARLKLRRAARGTHGGRVVWASGPCRRCGVQFVGKQNYSGQVPCYCSKRCSTADTRDRRRAQKAGVTLTKGRRHRVFERDCWVCQICGDPVNRQTVVPALDAATIDHRIPLAAGGAHEEANWQTAHFYCNSVKQDRLGFEFIA